MSVVGKILDNEDIAQRWSLSIPDASYDYIALSLAVHPVDAVRTPLPYIGGWIDAVPNRSHPKLTLVT
jgi:hypothetical protein